jgi:arylsulfatase A-like enzyme
MPWRTRPDPDFRGLGGLRPGGVLVVGALVVVGVLLIARGLGIGASSAPSTPSRTAPAPTASFSPVQPGAGVFVTDAPGKTATGAGGASCVDCDVVLLTVCSLRKDHVGAYGAAGVHTPHLDRVAAAGTRFERAYAASNFTLASLTAVLTGRFGSKTGVTGWDKGLTQDVPTLPEVLGHYGYLTGGFSTDAPSGFRPDYGLDRGFQHLEITPPPPGTPDGRHLAGNRKPGAAIRPAEAWLTKQPQDQPVFMMVHTRTAHFPFVVDASGADDDPTGITQLLYDAGRTTADDSPMPGMAGGTAQEGVVQIAGPDPLQVQVRQEGAPAIEMWHQRYREAVNRTDDDMGALWAALEARGRLGQTILIVVADHGESLNDHEELLHGDAFFDGVINVPLLMSIPGGTPGIENALVSQVDILPTVLELVGATTPAGIDGVSLVPLLRGEVSAVRAAALSEGGVARQEGPQLPGAVIAPPWQLLRQRRGCGTNSPPPTRGMPVCLFHMEDDPGQERNLAAAHPAVVQALSARWAGFQETVQQADRRLDLSPAFIEELQKSGYDFRPVEP